MNPEDRDRFILPREQPWDDDDKGPAAVSPPVVHATVKFDWSELWEKVLSWTPWGRR